MIIEIDDKIISSEIIEKKFVCDLNACKGACCVKGDAGAPLTLDEINLLEEEIEQIKPFLRLEGITAIEKTGVFYVDTTKDLVSTLVNNAECAFAVFDEKGTAKCGIELAHNAGKSTLLKPISCHLYPIRVKETSLHTILNFDSWEVCNPACKLGESLQVKTYQFLKNPIIRAFGKAFYQELETLDDELTRMKP
jgi:hypothetical protein